MLRDSKEFLKSFNKNRNAPNAEYTVDADTADDQNSPCYYCECRIPGFENIGVGESHSKRHAELRAAKHLCKQLKDMELLGEAEIAQMGLDEPDPPSDEETLPLPSQQLITHSTIPDRKVVVCMNYCNNFIQPVCRDQLLRRLICMEQAAGVSSMQSLASTNTCSRLDRAKTLISTQWDLTISCHSLLRYHCMSRPVASI